MVPKCEDAEEVFQETCLAMLEKWQHFDPSRPMVAWACGIARNMARRLYERNRHEQFFLSEIAIAAVSEVQQGLATEVDLRLQKLPECLQELTDEQRLLLEQCYEQQSSIRAIAEAHHVDPNTIYKRLERIRRSLFECIELAMRRERSE